LFRKASAYLNLTSCVFRFQYLRNGCTQYFTSTSTDSKVAASQKSQAQTKKGPLRDPLLDDVADFQSMDQVRTNGQVFIKQLFCFFAARKK